jgi:hypothetical protein
VDPESAVVPVPALAIEKSLLCSLILQSICTNSSLYRPRPTADRDPVTVPETVPVPISVPVKITIKILGPIHHDGKRMRIIHLLRFFLFFLFFNTQSQFYHVFFFGEGHGFTH